MQIWRRNFFGRVVGEVLVDSTSDGHDSGVGKGVGRVFAKKTFHHGKKMKWDFAYCEFA